MKDSVKRARIKQVQFRMPTELHKKLRKALIDKGESMADFFNRAADEYLRRRNAKGGDEEQKDDRALTSN